METLKPHVAILASPGMGHLIPLLELAKRLVSLHGFSVLFFVQTTYSSVAQSQLLISLPDSPGLNIVELPPADVSDIPSHADADTRIGLVMRRSMPALETSLSDYGSAGPLTALIVDIFGTDAFDIAHKSGLPKYLFCTSSAAFLAYLLYLPMLHQQTEGEFCDLGGPIMIPGCAPIQIKDLNDAVKDRKSEGYRWFLHHVRRYKEADGILVNTWDELDWKSLRALREEDAFKQIPTPSVYPIGPLIKEVQTSLRGVECLLWLDKQPPESVLFVSFGSGGSLSSAQVKELAWGLEQSQQRFLWVVRRPNDFTQSASFFSSGGNEDDGNLAEYLPVGFLDRTRDVGLVVPCWAPQVEILAHSSTGGFLTHCGWNSTLESLVHCVPMIAWPLYAEQRMNAPMLVDLRVAVRPIGAGDRVVGRKEIERVVRLVMEGVEGNELKAKTTQLRDSAIRTSTVGGSGYNLLCQVANDWKMALDRSLHVKGK
ncbi:hypothetical protein AAC387_Pa10g1545 [Persea americana]